MTELEIDNLFDGFNDLTCLIIGDVMVDAYILGGVNRISPEAPVPIFEVKKRENRLGGAANVALNIQALGATPILCGIIGNDVKGNVFEEVMASKNLLSKGIIKSNDRLTTCKTRIISSSHHMLRVDEEEVSSISKSDSIELVNRVKTIIKEQKVEKLKALAKKTVDIKGIGYYSLGAHRKNLSDSKKKEYIEVFEKYFLKSFSSRLAEYTNPEIDVLGKEILSEKYTIVNSLLKGTAERPEIKIDWRIYTKNKDKPLIRDLIIEGLSLARTQKEEFNSVLQSNNNDITELFKTLESFIKN